MEDYQLALAVVHPNTKLNWSGLVIFHFFFGRKIMFHSASSYQHSWACLLYSIPLIMKFHGEDKWLSSPYIESDKILVKVCKVDISLKFFHIVIIHQK